MYDKIQSPNGNYNAVVSDTGHLWVGGTDISAAVADTKSDINTITASVNGISGQINNVNASLSNLGEAIESKSDLKIKEGTNTITFSVVGNDVIVWIGSYRMGAITFK